MSCHLLPLARQVSTAQGRELSCSTGWAVMAQSRRGSCFPPWHSTVQSCSCCKAGDEAMAFKWPLHLLAGDSRGHKLCLAWQGEFKGLLHMWPGVCLGSTAQCRAGILHWLFLLLLCKGLTGAQELCWFLVGKLWQWARGICVGPPLHCGGEVQPELASVAGGHGRDHGAPS